MNDEEIIRDQLFDSAVALRKATGAQALVCMTVNIDGPNALVVSVAPDVQPADIAIAQAMVHSSHADSAFRSIAPECHLYVEMRHPDGTAQELEFFRAETEEMK